MDNRLVKHITGSVSFIRAFKINPPERSLDLGCGVRYCLLLVSCGEIGTRILATY